jgi:hypothetical protein
MRFIFLKNVGMFIVTSILKNQKHPEHNKLPAHHKIKNTVKILDYSTPGGLVSYVSEAYGGCTSDRQIVELARLLDYVIRVTV